MFSNWLKNNCSEFRTRRRNVTRAESWSMDFTSRTPRIRLSVSWIIRWWQFLREFSHGNFLKSRNNLDNAKDVMDTSRGIFWKYLGHHFMRSALHAKFVENLWRVMWWPMRIRRFTATCVMTSKINIYLCIAHAEWLTFPDYLLRNVTNARDQ